MMSEDVMLASARNLAEAFNRHDIAGSISLLSASARCHRGDGGAVLGREECADLLSAVARAFPDARLADVRAAIIGDKVIAEWLCEGTHRGAWSLAERMLEATGRSVRFSGALLLGSDEEGLIDSVEEGWIRRHRWLRSRWRLRRRTAKTSVRSPRATRRPGAAKSPRGSRTSSTPRRALSVNGGAPAVGHEAITAVAEGFMTAFPDLIVEMDDLHVSADRAVYCWTLKGTHGGPGGGGNRVQISGYEVWRFGLDGLIAESRGYFDSGAYNRQLVPSS